MDVPGEVAVGAFGSEVVGNHAFGAVFDALFHVIETDEFEEAFLVIRVDVLPCVAQADFFKAVGLLMEEFPGAGGGDDRVTGVFVEVDDENGIVEVVDF